MDYEDNNPSELTRADVDKFTNDLLNYEYQEMECIKCRKKFCETQLNIDRECDECFFSQFPKEEVTKFCKRFLEIED